MALTLVFCASCSKLLNKLATVVQNEVSVAPKAPSTHDETATNQSETLETVVAPRPKHPDNLLEQQSQAAADWASMLLDTVPQALHSPYSNSKTCSTPFMKFEPVSSPNPSNSRPYPSEGTSPRPSTRFPTFHGSRPDWSVPDHFSETFRHFQP